MSEERAIEPTEPKEIVIAQPALPVVSPEEARKAMETYQQLCAAILIPWDKRIIKNGVIVQDSDYQRISTKIRDPETKKDIYVYRDFPKKSAWRKLGKFYSISTEILHKERVVKEAGGFEWHYTVKATAPNGQSTTGEGVCSSSEVQSERRREHDTKSTAHTRAKNRAISDLIGFGQVSAEEVTSPGRKQVDADVVVVTEEKPAQNNLVQGKVNVKTVAYNLKAAGVGDEVGEPFEEGDLIVVEPTRKLEDPDHYRIFGVLEPMGANWKEVGFYGRWVLPKKG